MNKIAHFLEILSAITLASHSRVWCLYFMWHFYLLFHYGYPLTICHAILEFLIYQQAYFFSSSSEAHITSRHMTDHGLCIFSCWSSQYDYSDSNITFFAGWYIASFKCNWRRQEHCKGRIGPPNFLWIRPRHSFFLSSDRIFASSHTTSSGLALLLLAH